MNEMRPYLEFLRYCVDDHADIPASAKEIDWEALFVFARQQTVEATYWHGIERLDREGGLKLSESSVLDWMARYKKIEKRSRSVYKKVAWVWKNFQSEGFRSCLLKGQGNALLYPTPYMRTPGDIDIWVEGSDKDVIAYIDTVIPGQKRVYHHIEFIKSGKVPIEVHYRPCWMSNPIHNKRLQQWFADHSEECFSNKLEEWGFCVPSERFNLVYLLSHIYSHLLREGVGLRHVVDYYYLLLKSRVADRPSEAELRHLGLHKITGAMMWVLQEVLALPDAFLLCRPDARRGRLLLNEMLQGGNFGKFDERVLGGTSTTALRHNTKGLFRDLRFLFYFPSECLCEPFFRLWHYYWRWKHRPSQTP